MNKPQHDNDGTFTSSHHHKGLPYHQRRCYYQCKIQNLRRQLFNQFVSTFPNYRHLHLLLHHTRRLQTSSTNTLIHDIPLQSHTSSSTSPKKSSIPTPIPTPSQRLTRLHSKPQTQLNSRTSMTSFDLFHSSSMNHHQLISTCLNFIRRTLVMVSEMVSCNPICIFLSSLLLLFCSLFAKCVLFVTV